jgi:alpha-tubulin suppressor-like RCC1 family protein
VSHTLFVSIYGEVYTVGRSEHGKLGLGRAIEAQGQVVRPSKVHFDTRPAPSIVAASAGAGHSLFLASNGDCWGCGLASAGSLPTTHKAEGNYPIVWTPTHLDKLDAFCTAIAAGASLSFFVGECGGVFFSGTARQTSCPFGRSRLLDPSTPYRIPGLKQIEQVTVSMEFAYFQWEHAVFVHQSGRLYAWGHLGHGEFSPINGLKDCSPKARKGRCAWQQVGEPAGLNFCNSAVPVDHWPGLAAAN